MSISKLVTRILSGLLALICLICLLTGAISLKDFLDNKAYWERPARTRCSSSSCLRTVSISSRQTKAPTWRA